MKAVMMKRRPMSLWFEVMSQYDICAAPVLSLDEVFEDPHNTARGMLLEIEHPTVGTVKQAGIAAKLSDTPGKVRSTAPLPGQQTDEVLKSLGYSDDQVRALHDAGAV